MSVKQPTFAGQHLFFYLLILLNQNFRRFYFSHFTTLVGPTFDLPTHNRPMADKRDQVGMNSVPQKKSKPQRKISRENSHTTRANKGRSPLLFLNAINCELTTSEKRVGRWLFHSFLQNLSTVDFIKININELTNDHEGVTSSSRDHIKIIQNTTNHSYGAIMNCRSPRTWND